MSIFDKIKSNGNQPSLFDDESDLATIEQPEAPVEPSEPGNINAVPEAIETEQLESDGGEESIGSPPAPPTGFEDVFYDDGDGEQSEISRFAEKAYLEYAMSMVKGRALPYCQDGQKPVQKRILYAMWELGLTSSAKPVKSARVVGDVIGKYHPHGDTSAYDAAVRLSQRFTLRYPLINGQGNFGSRDGDRPAAMRYTEMRLTAMAELLLSELNQGTVDFIANYDGSFDEPALLPARLPMLLLNGAEGIAVGMATRIPPHNLNEVCEAAILAVNGKANLDNVTSLITGPDFPEGGQVISSLDEIKEAYKTGSGTLRVRARWVVEPLARGQYRIIIEELPYGVGALAVMREIDVISNPKPRKDKKSLEQDQIAMKQTLLSMVSKIRNESGKSVRIIIEPETSKVNADDLMNFLFTNTSLEETYSINMTMMGIDGKPARKNIVETLDEWAIFRFETVTRRTQHALNKTNARIHILEGRMIAFLHIDKVIHVIRNSDEPKADLIREFKLSDIQAEDILEIRLRQLAKLEGIRIESEIKSLREESDKLMHLLENEGSMRKLIVKEIRDDMARFGDDRRTLIEPVERVRVAVSTMVPDEPMTVLLSKQGWIRSRQGHGLDLTTVNWRPGDGLLQSIETRTTYPVILLDQLGRSYSVPASSLPGGKSDGVPVSSMVDVQSGGKVTHIFSSEVDRLVLLAGQNGYGFIAPVGKMVAKVKAGKSFMTLETGESMLPPILLGDETHVAMFTEKRLLVFLLDEVKHLPNGGKGVQLMIPDEGCKIQQMTVLSEPLELAVPGKRKNQKLSGDALAKYVVRRARKGCMLN